MLLCCNKRNFNEIRPEKQKAGINTIALFSRFKVVRCIKGSHTKPHVYSNVRKLEFNTIRLVSFICINADWCSTERLLKLKSILWLLDLINNGPDINLILLLDKIIFAVGGNTNSATIPVSWFPLISSDLKVSRPRNAFFVIVTIPLLERSRNISFLSFWKLPSWRSVIRLYGNLRWSNSSKGFKLLTGILSNKFLGSERCDNVDLISAKACWWIDCREASKTVMLVSCKRGKQRLIQLYYLACSLMDICNYLGSSKLQVME